MPLLQRYRCSTDPLIIHTHTARTTYITGKLHDNLVDHPDYFTGPLHPMQLLATTCSGLGFTEVQCT